MTPFNSHVTGPPTISFCFLWRSAFLERHHSRSTMSVRPVCPHMIALLACARAYLLILFFFRLRVRRVRKIDNRQADEDHPPERVFARRTPLLPTPHLEKSPRERPRCL